MELTDLQLSQVMRNASQRQRANCLEALNAAMRTYGIDNLPRTAAFLAQLAHESGELRWMEEIWGPTAAQKRYEPPSSLAKRLGNSESGDGKRYKGRGPIQVTGRFNYRKYGDLLGLDLEANPDQAATPDIGFATAGLYWEHNGLNELADADDFKQITKRINGGQNGAADRERFFERAKLVLAAAFPQEALAPAKDRSGKAAGISMSRAQPVRDELPRGAESIRAEEAEAAPENKKETGGGKKAAEIAAAPKRVLDARPDTMDFRDQMYVPTLVEVPTHVPLNEYHEHNVPILDQGSEGACTGFGMATVANYLLLRRRVIPDPIPVSARMFYELARRYDEWPGEDYSGSSARGAMKGWHKHGVCAEHEYPYVAGKKS
ncbi:MAG: glycoside hydrolase family 19 protein, partial [Burkholderiales bacterium]